MLPDADGHVGGVEVDDGQHQDAARQAVRVGRGRRGWHRCSAVPPAPPRSVERTIAAVAQTLPPPDADGDGILDHEDACPDRAGVQVRRSAPPRLSARRGAHRRAARSRRSRRRRRGRRRPHQDAASTRPTPPSRSAPTACAQPVNPTPPRAVERAIAAIATTLPIADTDKDGDPRRARRVPRSRRSRSRCDPLRHGCPPATEKVVVLPDADGHVGAIEIDDGKTQGRCSTPPTPPPRSATAASQATPASPATAIARATAGDRQGAAAADRDDDNVVDRERRLPRPRWPAVVAADPPWLPARRSSTSSWSPTRTATSARSRSTTARPRRCSTRRTRSAEVGTDGRARTLPAEPAEVSAAVRRGDGGAPARRAHHPVLHRAQRAGPRSDRARSTTWSPRSRPRPTPRSRSSATPTRPARSAPTTRSVASARS